MMTMSPPAWARACLSSELRRWALTTAMVAPRLLATRASEMLPALLTEIPSWRSSSATAIVPGPLGLSIASRVLEVVRVIHRVMRTGRSRRARTMTIGRHRCQRWDQRGLVTWSAGASTSVWEGGCAGCDDVDVGVLIRVPPGLLQWLRRGGARQGA